MSGDSDSDSDSELIRVSSTPLPPPKWDKAPGDIDFKLKLKLNGPAGRRKRRIYTLKKGVVLPYSTNCFEGLTITFQKTLDPFMAGHVAQRDGEYWIFKDEGESSSVVEGDILTLSPMAVGSKDTMVGLSQSSTATPHSHRDRSPSPRQLFDREPGSGSAGVQDNIMDEVNSEYDSEISKVILRLDSSGIIQIKCALCSFVSETKSMCETHIGREHPGWKKEISTDMAMPVNNSPHTNRTWLQDLTGDFYNVVIVKCAEKCREAVQANKHIEDPREWNETFDQIFNTTIDHLETVFGGVSVPRLCDVREIISTLGLVYPAMFRESKPANVSEVLRGFAPAVKIPGLSQLAQRMIDRFRGRAKKRKQSSDAEPEENPPKRGKPKLIYGLNC